MKPTISELDKVLLGDLFKEMERFPILPKENGPYTFAPDADNAAVTNMLDKHGNVRAVMPTDTYQELLKYNETQGRT